MRSSLALPGTLCGFLFAVVGSAADSSSSGSAGCSASSSGRRLGSGASWYCEAWEKDHVEAAATAAMLLIAMLFEAVYHNLLHRAEHSFVFGHSMLSEEEKEVAHRRQKFSKPLRLILFMRMGGEFMVLGFLAFTIWTANQQELFDSLAKIESSVRLPTSGPDYLHLLEAVHMQLFVAMLLYFTLAFRVVNQSDTTIRHFEESRATWIKQLNDGTNGDNDSNELKQFKLWRGLFVGKCVPSVLIWRRRKPVTFKHIMMRLNVQKDLADLTVDDLTDAFTARFSFCSYLVYSLCHSVMQVITLTQTTMFSIVAIKMFYVVLHRAAHVPLEAISPVFSALCFVFILILYSMTRGFKQSLLKENYTPMKGFGWVLPFMDWLAERCNPETGILTTLQVLLFFMCHTWAGSMISKDYWHGVFSDGDPGKTTIAVVYIPALCALAFLLPYSVPDFAAIMALPPFFSHNNEKVLELVAVQVVDAQMMKAREAAKKRGVVQIAVAAKEEVPSHEPGIRSAKSDKDTTIVPAKSDKDTTIVPANSDKSTTIVPAKSDKSTAIVPEKSDKSNTPLPAKPTKFTKLESKPLLLPERKTSLEQTARQSAAATPRTFLNILMGTPRPPPSLTETE